MNIRNDLAAGTPVTAHPTTIAKFFVVMSQSVSLSWLSSELMANGTAGLKSVAWSEPTKKG